MGIIILMDRGIKVGQITKFLPVCGMIFLSMVASTYSIAVPCQQEFVTYQHSNRDLKLMLHKPHGEGPFPVVVAIYGGAFKGGNRFRFDASFIEFFTQKNWAVACIEYRSVFESGQHPNAIFDCIHNVHWIADHAETLDLNKEQIITIGSSAGAYLATMVALYANTEDFQPPFGPYHQKNRTKISGAISSAAMYDWTAIQNGEQYIQQNRHSTKASPLHGISDLSCNLFLLLGGEDDHNWSPATSALAMKKAIESFSQTNDNKQVELYLKKNTSHPALYDSTSEYGIWAFEKIESFLSHCLSKTKD